VRVRRVALEGFVVLLAGAAVALAANALSPVGLKLTRNYFPKTVGTNPAVAVAHSAPATNVGSASSPANPTAVAIRLREQGLQLIEHDAVAQLYHDPRRLQEQVLFVDARDDRHYQEGHIPGALQFDHYRPEAYLPAVLVAAQFAEQMVIYCNGGECEDSEFAAITLTQAGVPGSKLFVYAGGFEQWSTNGMPVEIGGRNSGQVRGTPP
jgi:rhodanese-related sulfurtransferase